MGPSKVLHCSTKQYQKVKHGWCWAPTRVGDSFGLCLKMFRIRQTQGNGMIRFDLEFSNLKMRVNRPGMPRHDSSAHHIVAPCQGNFSEAGKDVTSEEEYHAVRQAVFSCPQKAIRWVRQPKVKLARLPFVYEGFPKKIEDNVYFMGHSDVTTFGAAGFFIQSQGSNVMIDPPIAHPKLVEAVNRMGGVHHLLATHVDHTANIGVWHEITKAPRLMHKADLVETKNDYSPFPVTKDYEVILSLKPLETATLKHMPDLEIIHTPGHSPGSIMFLYKKKFLFTGDSLAFSPAKGHLHAHRVQCWQSWELQTKSMEGLLNHDFSWVLAGHGDWKSYETTAAAHADLERCVSWMRGQGKGRTWLPLYVLWTFTRNRPPGLFTLLADSFLMTQGAKDQFPNFTLPSWFTGLIMASMLIPAVVVVHKVQNVLKA